MIALSRRASVADRLPPAWVITAAFCVAYLIVAPPSSDLAAAAYRSDLFSRVGFTLWDNSWYGGHHLPAYSLLAPALGALIGPQLLAAVSMIAATALFSALIEGRFRRRATRAAGLWFAAGACFALLSNRVPFDLGQAIGLGALLAAQRQRSGLAAMLCLLSAIASPVDGAFLAMAFAAWALAGPERARPAALAVLSLAPVGVLAVLFPEGGSQPFAGSAFYPAVAGVLAIAYLVPREERILRTGALLYAAALIASFLLSTAVGSNSDRLGAQMGAAVIALLLLGSSTIGRRPQLLLALSPLLIYWQANSPVTNFAAAISDPAVNASYYTPLLKELGTFGVGYGARPARIEVVPVNDHWEARWMAPHVMLARGWERQLDRYRNGLFYDESQPLTAAAYGAWLSQQSVSYVALPDAALDYSAQEEARLLRGAGPGARGRPPSYLREVWRSAHWRLFAVANPRPLIEGPATLQSVGTDSFTLRAASAGRSIVRLHYSSYWALAGGHGCVSQAPGDWTRVEARAAGVVRVVISFSLTRIFEKGPRCR